MEIPLNSPTYLVHRSCTSLSCVLLYIYIFLDLPRVSNFSPQLCFWWLRGSNFRPLEDSGIYYTKRCTKIFDEYSVDLYSTCKSRNEAPPSWFPWNRISFWLPEAFHPHDPEGWGTPRQDGCVDPNDQSSIHKILYIEYETLGSFGGVPQFWEHTHTHISKRSTKIIQIFKENFMSQSLQLVVPRRFGTSCLPLNTCVVDVWVKAAVQQERNNQEALVGPWATYAT